jgi:hypothetical protein
MKHNPPRLFPAFVLDSEPPSLLFRDSVVVKVHELHAGFAGACSLCVESKPVVFVGRGCVLASGDSIGASAPRTHLAEDDLSPRLPDLDKAVRVHLQIPREHLFRGGAAITTVCHKDQAV